MAVPALSRVDPAISSGPTAGAICRSTKVCSSDLGQQVTKMILAPALRARDDVIEGQLLARPAILALETVAQEQVEAREGGKLRRLHELLQRDHAGQLQRDGGAAYFALIGFNNVDAIQEHRLDRGLPWPEAERVIGERRIVGVEHERRAAIGMADQVGMEHGPSSNASRAPALSPATVTPP